MSKFFLKKKKYRKGNSVLNKKLIYLKNYLFSDNVAIFNLKSGFYFKLVFLIKLFKFSFSKYLFFLYSNTKNFFFFFSVGGVLLCD